MLTGLLEKQRTPNLANKMGNKYAAPPIRRKNQAPTKAPNDPMRFFG